MGISKNVSKVVSTLEDLVSYIYPGISNIQGKSMEWLCERAILTTKNDAATGINSILFHSFEGEEMEYKSVPWIQY